MAASRSPAVSVLLPVRDAGSALSACLDSLAVQSLADHEVIAVDDGSCDGSGERLAERATLDPRLRLLRTPPRGIAAALNHALAEARAKIVVRMDADDVAHVERLRLQVDRLAGDAEVDVLGCRVATRRRPLRELARACGRTRRGSMASSTTARWPERASSSRRSCTLPWPCAPRRSAHSAATATSTGPRTTSCGSADSTPACASPSSRTLLEWRDSPGRLTRTDPRYSARAFVRLKVEALARGPLARSPGGHLGCRPDREGLRRARSRARRATSRRVRRGRRAQDRPAHPRRAGGRRRRGTAIRGALHLGAVGQKGAREQILEEAARHGLADGEDIFAVA